MKGQTEGAQKQGVTARGAVGKGGEERGAKWSAVQSRVQLQSEVQSVKRRVRGAGARREVLKSKVQLQMGAEGCTAKQGCTGVTCSAKLGAAAEGCRGAVQSWGWGAAVDPKQKVMVKQCKDREVQTFHWKPALMLEQQKKEARMFSSLSYA